MSFLLSRFRPLPYFALFWVAWCNATVGRPETIGGQSKNALVLYGDRLSMPAIKTTEQGLMAGLSRGPPEDLEIFSEYLDLARFPAAQYGDDLVRYLRTRYAARKPDVVIVVGSSALDLALVHRDGLFPGVPIVFANVDLREEEGRQMPSNVTGLSMAWDYRRTVELALQLQPETREIVCVGGAGIQEQQWNNEARKVLERFATRVRTRWLDKLPFQAVLDEVARLPLDSVVLYVPMRRDGAGKSISPFEVARQLAEASRVPVYGLSRSELEEGIIGGALLDFSEAGRKTAALTFHVLNGEMPMGLTPPDPATDPLVVNWHALKKWHVSEGRIPGAATVLYRGPGLWERHRRLILISASIFGLQSVLIVWLIVQRLRRKRVERALRDSEERMSLAAEAANLGMWHWDLVSGEIWMTDRGRALVGIGPETRLDTGTLTSRVHPEDRAVRDAALKHAIETHGEYAMEYRVLLPDGTLRWIGARGHCTNVGDNQRARLLGVSMDVTAQKQAQERFRLAVEASSNGIVLVNAQGHIVLVNACVEKLFGYGREELIGQDIELLVPEWFPGDHLVHRAGFHAAPVARSMGAGLELFARRKDGTEFPVEIGISPIQSPEGTLVLSVIVDITERKQAEVEAQQHREEVAHLSRLAVIGEMAGSLAHELNQPLGAIVTNADAALRFLERNNLSGEKLRELLQDIAADGKRAGDVIRTVKGIGRKEAGARRLLQLNEVIAEVLRLVRSEALARDCIVVTELHPAPPKVEANQVQLQEVFLNLILNAFDASKDVPTVRRRVIIRTEPDGLSSVRASVRDFGTGLPADLPERVFDRFFSTKQEGMGIGLFIARSIVAAHGGTLFAENAEGGGAEFCLRLPVSKEIGV
jgi:PAS domain S-box-containing protein